MKFGLIGPGTIAAKFAEAAKQVDGVELARIASSKVERAQAFAAAHGTGVGCSYEELLADDSIDAVYVSVINTRHYEMTKRCLEAGKAVICEKPFCPTAEEEKELFTMAEEKGLLLMEAMWTPFLPCIRAAKQWVDEGKIGNPAFIDSAFSFYNPTDPKGRLFDPAKAGGGLYDVGIYTLAFSLFLAGSYPTVVQSSLTMGETGVDTVGSALLSFRDGKQDNLHAQCLFGVQGPIFDDAHIAGDQGWIEIPHFWGARKAVLHRPMTEADFEHENSSANGGAERLSKILSVQKDYDTAFGEEKITVEDPRENGFTYEIEAFRDAWKDRRLEVEPVNHAFSYALARLMQEVRESAM